MNPFEQIVRSEGELREIVGTPGARRRRIRPSGVPLDD
jgi:hypothetical protein